MTNIRTAPLRVLSKAIRNPERALLRLVLNARLARWSIDEARHRLLALLAANWNVDAEALHVEYCDSKLAEWHRIRLAELRKFRGPMRLGTTGELDCEALYLLVRATRPRIVVETGVLYGALSAHLLAALERNGAGELYSIELGRAADEPPHSFFVPDELTERWHLVLGDSRNELPRLLAEIGPIDLFHHDSLHTFEHMTWEYETVLPYLSPHGVLSSHDVIVAHSIRHLFSENAFPAFCRQRNLKWQTVRNLGLAWQVGEQAPRAPI